MGKGIVTILMLGAIGGIAFTFATHPVAVHEGFVGIDSLYKTAVAGTLGQVA